MSQTKHNNNNKHSWMIRKQTRGKEKKKNKRIAKKQQTIETFGEWYEGNGHKTLKTLTFTS